MQTYITLIRFTDRGLSSIKDGPARLQQAKKAFQAAGAELKAFYLTTGRFDAVVVTEAPDDATVARLSLSIGAQGNSRSETLRAFTEEEYRKIVSELA